MIQIQNNEISYIFEEGGWIIRPHGNEWVLIEIPQFGGEERIVRYYPNHHLHLAIQEGLRMT